MSRNADPAAGKVIEALSDPTRRQVVTLLSGGPKRAGELAAEVGMSAPAMSRHLRVLMSALVIADERLTRTRGPGSSGSSRSRSGPCTPGLTSSRPAAPNRAQI